MNDEIEYALKRIHGTTSVLIRLLELERIDMSKDAFMKLLWIYLNDLCSIEEGLLDIMNVYGKKGLSDD